MVVKAARSISSSQLRGFVEAEFVMQELLVRGPDRGEGPGIRRTLSEALVYKGASYRHY